MLGKPLTRENGQMRGRSTPDFHCLSYTEWVLVVLCTSRRVSSFVKWYKFVHSIKVLT
jgi:hypothetical protein